jgi:uncharacterized protein YkwD
MSVRSVFAAASIAFTLCATEAFATDPWAQQSAGPSPAAAPDARDAALLAQCGAGDAVLHQAAAIAAVRSMEGHAAPAMHELTSWLHRHGDPHVRARAWTLRGKSLERSDASSRLQVWLDSREHSGVRRCGIASVLDSDKGEAIAVVAIDAVADLARPIPTRIRTASWVTFEATLQVPSDFVKVVVLGPRGQPRPIPTSYDPRSRRVLARFNADAPGHWSAQLLTSTRAGPLPSLEADLFADVEPEAPSARAPGEASSTRVNDEATAMVVMLNVARRSENAALLTRDIRLDAVAEQHARAMVQAGALAHASGDGTPETRLDQAGIAVQESGENVAHAADPVAAHRALWFSPSHRTNMLHPRFTRVGVAAVRDGAGSLWVTEVFAGRDVPAQASY